MAKASDNAFPSVLLVEQASAPATPAAGQARLYRGTDNKLYMVDDAGTATQVGGSTGGSGVRTAVARRTAGNLSFNTTGWQSVSTALDLTIAAAAGDVAEFGVSAFVDNQGNTLAFDAVTMVGGAAVSTFGAQGAVASRPSNGVLSWYANASAYWMLSGSVPYTLGAGDVSGGNVTLRLQVNPSNTTARNVLAVAATPLMVWAKVWTP